MLITFDYLRTVHKLYCFLRVAFFLNSHRKQRVLVNGTRSEWEAVSSGVPQGSVLGPVLFLIYINDLPKEVKNCIRLFADDTKLYRTVTTDLDCLSLQQDIDNIEEWASKWQPKEVQDHEDRRQIPKV